MQTEKLVSDHYTHGTLERTIVDALRKAGFDPERLTAADLAPVDEFHIGGRQATAELAAQMEIERGARLLDIGSGLGGPSRYFAEAHG
jgi:cyclopropane fatty-acyl-phospholipid synthase-like methyltransferase